MFDFRVPVRGLDAERSAESQKLLAVLLNISLVKVGLLEPLVAVVEISTEQGPRGVGVDSLVAGMRRSQRSGRQETGKDGLEFHLSACEETGEKTSERCLLKREKRDHLFTRPTDTTKQKSSPCRTGKETED
jgi:hypothetical protein